ncbi:hypothetical protein RND71_044103 [Anisodus tanguticus]|uniref:Amidase domain-containing protein n=1 Tax=Anisodus tanguticus TaxID=243964 RepID=A0AAE1QP53_9SOLA|nr:hypothetical protein RND71_044103 [Anisodus tanguticus]
MGCGSITSFYGPIKNPWKSHISFKVVDKNNDVLYKNKSNEDDWYIAGGSSGGSAVAVATGTCFAALASDTGGSTRNPASRVGVIGYKPSYGSISRHGLIPLTHSMDVPGIMTRYVDCCEQIFNLIKGKDLSDSTSVKIDIKKSGSFKDKKDFQNIKIGIPEEYNCDGLSDEIKSLWKETADYLENCGAKVEKISLPHRQQPQQLQLSPQVQLPPVLQPEQHLHFSLLHGDLHP